MGSNSVLTSHQGGRTATMPPVLEHSAPAEVLEELFVLLEEFGPQWYTEELHDRAVAALRAE